MKKLFLMLVMVMTTLAFSASCLAENGTGVYSTDLMQRTETMENGIYGAVNYLPGKTISVTGAIIDDETRCVTEFIDVSEINPIYRFYYGADAGNCVLAEYDANKKWLGNVASVSGKEWRGVSVKRSGTRFIRFSFNSGYDARFTDYVGAKNYWKAGRVGGIVSLVRRVINIKATDTPGEVVTKMITAFNTGNVDVSFERAHYVLDSEVPYLKTKYGMPHNEIPIGNGCRYYFNGATLEATVNLAEHPAANGEEFYSNLLGCQRVPSSFELYDGILIAKDTRYVVHDESTAMKGSYRHVYHNMSLEYRTGTRKETIRKCIGGGTGADGVIDIEGCKFVTDGSDPCVSYHGNAKDVVGAAVNINVRNSWFSNNMRVCGLSAHQQGRLFYCGNSAASVPDIDDRWNVCLFNNELRKKK